MINPDVALAERESRCLNGAQMAEILGLEGLHADEIPRYFETGNREPRGPVLRVYESLYRGRWGASHLLKIPRWTFALFDPDGPVIHHNEWPRFVAKAFAVALHPEQWRFKKAEMPVFALDERTGFCQLVVSFVDHVPEGFDPEDLVAEAIRRFEQSFIGGDHGH